MKIKELILACFFLTVLSVSAQVPVYLDVNKPIEERVQDALARMTLEEKNCNDTCAIKVQFSGSCSSWHS